VLAVDGLRWVWFGCWGVLLFMVASLRHCDITTGLVCNEKMYGLDARLWVGTRHDQYSGKGGIPRDA
jgi:hypothetical protein